LNLLTQCLACGNNSLELILDLHNQPLANNYTDGTSTEEQYPLAVNICKNCCHLQLTHAVDPTIIYTNYLYVSGTAQTNHDYMSWFVPFSCEYVTKWPTNVLDIGCNDGSQLDKYRLKGLRTFGVDPAENLYSISSANHTVWCDFFGPELVNTIDQKFDIIVAQNSFAHSSDPIETLQAMRQLMGHDSVLFIQTSQADMVRNGEFDTIYHEHINFFNINSMDQLCKRAKLNLLDVQRTPIHGNSYVFVISATRSNPARIANLIAMEAKDGLLDFAHYHMWANNIVNNMSELKSQLQELRLSGHKLVGYGASAKGNTVLNYIDFALDFIVDDNPLKHGYYTPGQHCPIVPITHLDTVTEPIVFVALAWNFGKEITERIRNYRPSSTIIKYFPQVSHDPI
jgi:hypothetical protein